MSADALREEAKRVGEAVEGAKAASPDSPVAPKSNNAFLEMVRYVKNAHQALRHADSCAGAVAEEWEWFGDAEDELNDLHALLASRGVPDAKPNWRESVWASVAVAAILDERGRAVRERDGWIRVAEAANRRADKESCRVFTFMALWVFTTIGLVVTLGRLFGL